MAITADPIIVPPLKITYLPPSLVAVSIDDPVMVPNDEAELEKLVESRDTDLDETINFRSLCSVIIPKTFLSTGISTADIVVNNPVYHIDVGMLLSRIQSYSSHLSILYIYLPYCLLFRICAPFSGHPFCTIE